MHLTLETDYAVRIVSCLAQEYVNAAKRGEDSRLDAKTIAERTVVTPRFTLKILRKLVASGIVKSYKGAQGGYELARTPAEISLGDVIETTENTYCISRCLETGHPCSRGMSGICKFQKVFSEISAVMRERMNAYTFDMFVDE